MNMSRWKWIRFEGDTLRDIGVNPDGTLHNPNGYPDATVRAAIAEAEDRRHRQSSDAAKKAAATRRRRQEKRVYDVARRISTGEAYGPATACVICGRGLDDEQSIHRGIGSECWQSVLQVIGGA
jgi:hypothetical protein